ncbi:MAG: alpha/beta hydrolase [Anaerolineae bacterium]|nr:MAG: alpha/beta hydrolase [Anaerolineae bacterium]
MPLSLRARLWRRILRRMYNKQLAEIADSRLREANIAAFSRYVTRGVRVARFEIEGHPAAWLGPEGTTQDKLILYLHGGGYVSGSINTHLILCLPMTQVLQRTILLPEYRLAPEHPFPAALEDALDVYRALLRQGYSPRNIVIAGDSAGGGLSLATTLALREAGDPLPAAVVCLSPWADLTNSGASHLRNAAYEPALTAEDLRRWATWYAGSTPLTHPLISPVFADFRGFPPLLIQAGSQEILLDDACQLAQVASAAGVDVTLRIWQGLWHVWHALGSLIPESGQAFEEIREFIRSKE